MKYARAFFLGFGITGLIALSWQLFYFELQTNEAIGAAFGAGIGGGLSLILFTYWQEKNKGNK